MPCITGCDERRRNAPADLLFDAAAVERAGGEDPFLRLFVHPAQHRDALFDLLSENKPLAVWGGPRAATSARP